MKRTKREENSIVIYFAFYAVLLLLLLVYILTSMYPKIKLIETKKTTVNVTYEAIKSLNKEWLKFTEFNAMSKKAALNSYTKELMKSIEESFYIKHFNNDTDTEFLSFLEVKKDEFNDPILQQRFKQKQQQIIQLLPTYSEVHIEENDNILSDFKFINYLEALLQTFSLNYSNEIWLEDVVLLEEYSDNESKSKLNTSIYYIPVVLNIEWIKYNVINFLYFLDKVWGIDITEEWKIKLLNQNDDNFLIRWWRKTVLTSDDYVNEYWNKELLEVYNIYENQLIDIESITFEGYLDKNISISKDENDEWMYERVKKKQWDDKISLNLKLRFYVKWVQNIKMIEAIERYITYFNTTKIILNKEFKNKNLEPSTKSKIKKSQSVIKELSKELKWINISISRQENLVDTLIKASDLTDTLHTIHSQIWYNFYISNFLREYNALLTKEDLAKSNSELYSYINGIESKLKELQKWKTEKQESYNKRVNSKKYFQKALQYQRNINLKK